MDFTFTDEQRALRSAVRDMAQRLRPSGDSGDAPTGPQPFDREAWSALAEMGLLGLPFAEDKGGFGASAVEVSVAASELGAAQAALPYADAITAAAALSDAGHDLLGDVVDGSKVVLTALGERGRAWAPAAPARTASGSGDAWTIDGEGLAAVALDGVDAVVTTASADSELGVFLVQAPSVEGNTATFSGADAVRLGGEETLRAALDLGLVALGGEALGAMEAALKLTTEYLKTRKQFGVPLQTFQTLTQRAADMYVSVELARSTVLYTAMAVAEGADAGATSRMKTVLGRTGRHVGQEAIQLHGGIGMTAEHTVGRYTARLTAIEHTFGDTRFHLAASAATIGDHDEVDVLA